MRRFARDDALRLPGGFPGWKSPPAEDGGGGGGI